MSDQLWIWLAGFFVGAGLVGIVAVLFVCGGVRGWWDKRPRRRRRNQLVIIRNNRFSEPGENIGWPGDADAGKEVEATRRARTLARKNGTKG